MGFLQEVALGLRALKEESAMWEKDPGPKSCTTGQLSELGFIPDLQRTLRLTGSVTCSKSHSKW